MMGKNSGGGTAAGEASRRCRRGGTAVVLCAAALLYAGAGLAAAHPGQENGNNGPGKHQKPPIMRVSTSSAPMTPTPATATNTVASCPKGTELISGGMWGGRADPADPVTAINGLRAKGSFPSEANGTPSANGAKDPVFWSATGNFGGQSETGDAITSFAMCADKQKFDHRVVSVAAINAPLTVTATAKVTAACPKGTIVIGGGALGTPPESPSFKPVGSYPSDAAGNMLPNGARNPRFWTAVGSAGGAILPTITTIAYAICTKPGDIDTKVVRTDSAGPVEGSTFSLTSASCPKRTSLLAGGINTDNATGPLQNGVHLRGSYPSDAAGKPVGNATTDPTTWSGIVAAGGQHPGPDTKAHTFALCADLDHT